VTARMSISPSFWPEIGPFRAFRLFRDLDRETFNQARRAGYSLHFGVYTTWNDTHGAR
jgi:hypothetical protein